MLTQQPIHAIQPQTQVYIRLPKPGLNEREKGSAEPRAHTQTTQVALQPKP